MHRLSQGQDETGIEPTRHDADLDLVLQIQAGRRELFHDLALRHESAIFRGALAILRSVPDAEDATQETFLRAFRSIDQFRGECKFRTWLIQIAVNAARSRLGEARREVQEQLPFPPEENGRGAWEPADSRENPEQHYAREELKNIMLRVMAGLHPEYRSVLYLRDIQELSTNSAAQALGVTPESVRTRLVRARAALRARMESYWQRCWK